MNRRRFVSTTLFTLAAALSSMGLSCSSVFAAIAYYVGAGIDAVTSVVNLLAGAGIVTLPEGALISTVLQMIKAAWADVTAAVAAYNNAPAAEKTTFAGKVATALAVVQSEIQAFWNQLQIPDASLANTIAGLLGLVISTIEGFMPSLPAPQPIGPAPAPLSQKTVNKAPLTATPKKRSAEQFRKEFNEILAAGGHSKWSI